MLSNQQFDRTRRLALSLAGIELGDRHRDLIHWRGRRLGLVDNAGIDLLLGAVEQGDPSATQMFIGLLTTKFTAFFREPRQFQLAAEHSFRAVQKRGRARLWSAAAASGEEPYSLAMSLIETFGHEEPPTMILASDLDAIRLEIARQGEYTGAAVQPLEPGRRAMFFTEFAPGRWRLSASARRMVEFRVVNLAGISFRVEGPFDVIFCRNVLMYLEPCHRYSALEKLASLLAPDGLLFLDPTENLGKAERLFSPGTAGVFPSRRRSPIASRPKSASGPEEPTKTRL